MVTMLETKKVSVALNEVQLQSSPPLGIPCLCSDFPKVPIRIQMKSKLNTWHGSADDGLGPSEFKEFNTVVL